VRLEPGPSGEDSRLITIETPIRPVPDARLAGP